MGQKWNSFSDSDISLICLSLTTLLSNEIDAMNEGDAMNYDVSTIRDTLKMIDDICDSSPIARKNLSRNVGLKSVKFMLWLRDKRRVA